MEITDILKPQNLNLNGNLKQQIQAKDNKFKRLLDDNIAYKLSKPVKHEKIIDKRLMNACIEMESLFVSRMLKEMRKTVPEEKLIDGGYAEKIFEDMLYDEYSLNLSKTSNLGIANMLYKELSSK